MKKMWIVLLLSSLVMTVPVHASGGIIVIANGEPVVFTDQNPLILENRVMVPVRQVFENLGFTVAWDENSSTATLRDTNNQLSISVGKPSLIINGGEFPLEVPAQIILGRTYLPLRAVSEALGSEVNWKGESKTADIRYNGAKIILGHEAALPVTTYYPETIQVIDFGKLNPTGTMLSIRESGNQLLNEPELLKAFTQSVGLTESQIEKSGLWYYDYMGIHEDMLEAYFNAMGAAGFNIEDSYSGDFSGYILEEVSPELMEDLESKYIEYRSFDLDTGQSLVVVSITGIFDETKELLGNVTITILRIDYT